MNVFERFREAWSVFRGRDHPQNITPFTPGYGTGSIMYHGRVGMSERPDRRRMSAGNEKTLIASVYNRIALDVAAVEMHHAVIDDNENFKEVVKGDLEEFMNTEANIDQTSMDYAIDLVISMFDEGVVAEVPVDVDREDDGKIKKLYEVRTGQITEWSPEEVRVNLYNQLTGRREDVVVKKRETSIITNPFYPVMNEKNSLAKRLMRKLAIIDVVDEKNGSDKLNMIIQLPYVVRTDGQRDAARKRLKEMQDQLSESQLGVTYVDGTEKIIQLNRPLENNLQAQIEWLTQMFYSQLYINEEILNGTADEKTMTNYMNRIVATVCEAICAERRRKFLTKDQRKNGESIIYVQDPFRLIPVTQVAEIGDKMTRNAILSPNEVRGMIGYKPSDDPASDQLVNRNMPYDQTPGAAEANDGGLPEESTQEIAQSTLPAGTQTMNRAQRRRMERERARNRSG